jgi:hypothetical protein
MLTEISIAGKQRHAYPAIPQREAVKEGTRVL